MSALAEAILAGVAAGAFPMDDEPAGEVRFYIADPRGLMPVDGGRVPQSVARALRRTPFELRVDRAFDAVLAGCMAHGGPAWLTPRLAAAYADLHEGGSAHSLEIWLDGEQVAGMFGLSVGGLVTAESMYHRAGDAGNALLALASRHLSACGARLWDIQMLSPHVRRFGAFAVNHPEYLRRLRVALAAPQVRLV